MKSLNIISTLFNNSNFIKFLTFTFISLIILFFIILFLAYRDKHSENKTKIKWYKKFENKNKKDLNKKIKEDVTIEMPVISENLKQYKENIEMAISNDNHYDDIKPLIKNIKIKAPKHTRILDIDEIEETKIEPSFEINDYSILNNDDMDIILPKEREK